MEKNKISLEERQMFIEKLKLLIGQFLTLCDSNNSPYLCQHIQMEDGYKDVEEFCISNFMLNNTTIGDSLVIKENLLNPNYTIN
jgi:hypothetical protein